MVHYWAGCGEQDVEHALKGRYSPLAENAVIYSPLTENAVIYNHVEDTWNWLWKDTLGRIVPFVAATAIYARASGRGPHGVGFTSDGWARDLVFGTMAGIPLAGIAAVYRAYVAPRYRLPTAGDQVLQTAFYLAVNAPAEELFWRGMVQTLAISGLRRLPIRERNATALGWAMATLVFGAYHRLGNWSWRAIGGVTVAGGLFGAMYLATGKRRSLLLPTILHGFATAGFLSWGDVLLHRRNQHARLKLMRRNDE
jgi:membrane protease YdiL (CAAX protease family)